MTSPFHFAFPVRDLQSTRQFYLDTLGCREGRSGDDWIDIDFFGSQIVAHASAAGSIPQLDVNTIDGNKVPLPHFGAVLELDEWRALAERLSAGTTDWVIQPHVRFEGTTAEQASMILRDPSGNTLELKAMADPSNLFRV